MVSPDFFGFAAVFVAFSFVPVEEMARLGTGFFTAFVASLVVGLVDAFAGGAFTRAFGVDVFLAGTTVFAAILVRGLAAGAGAARRDFWTTAAAGAGAGFGAVVKFWMMTGIWAGAAATSGIESSVWLFAVSVESLSSFRCSFATRRACVAFGKRTYPLTP